MRKVLYILVVAVIYAIVVTIDWNVAQNEARRKSAAMARYARSDVVETLDSVLDASMCRLGYTIINEIGSERVLPQARVDRLKSAFGVDELNIISDEGVIVSSSNPSDVGFDMSTHPVTAEVLCVTNADTVFYAAPFKPSVINTNRVMKYLGISFPSGGGMLQIGHLDKTIARDFELVFGSFFGDWEIGECGYYLVLDDDGTVSVVTSGHEKYIGRKFSDLVSDIRHDEDYDVDRITFDGERCTSTSAEYTHHRIVAIVPDSELRLAASVETSITAAILLPLFVGVGILLWYAFSSKRKISELHAAEAKRSEEDLQVAKMIQSSAMPTIFPAYPHELRMDIHAMMCPAREVGGDFYDFFYVSPDRFFVLVADVSGKGIPAAMFMMKAKMLIKSLSSTIDSLSELANEVNARLCENNEALMFVTAWIGCVDLVTGRLEYVNAGHNPPVIRRADGSVKLLENVSGFFFAGDEATEYTVFHDHLQKGDTLLLYTDGVTESINARSEQFGEERLLRIVKTGGSPRRLCSRVKKEVDEFSGSAVQFDDITTLALLYRGLPETRNRVFDAKLSSMPEISEFAEKILVEFECPRDIISDILVAVDEVVNNIVSYSGSEKIGVSFESASLPSVVRLTFIDCGKRWNPLMHDDPDVAEPLEDRPVGGLGIMIVKNLMDNIFYEYKDGTNRLSFRKELPWRSSERPDVEGVSLRNRHIVPVNNKEES